MKAIIRKGIFLFSLVLIFFVGIYVGKTRGIPFVRETFGWSIAIYSGDDTLHFLPKKGTKVPALTARDVNDVPAEFVADPFLFKKDNLWYLFFEIMNAKTFQGDIGVAVSKDLNKWNYKKIVLDEPFHLSYPYVFKWKDEYYMIPEVYQTNSVKLYKAADFPNKWEYVETLIYGQQFVDPSVFYFNEKWWMFVATITNDTLYLYSSKELTGPWEEHPRSPVVKGDKTKSRPGGRVIVENGKIIRFAQDGVYHYGSALNAFEITELTDTNYSEIEWPSNPILKSGNKKWNKSGMHQLDAHKVGDNQWVASVDGQHKRLVFNIRY